MDDRFLKAFQIDGGCVYITGAGGKTSLIKRLALEAKAKGLSVAVGATTRMFLPDYQDFTDISGSFFEGIKPENAIYAVSDFNKDGKISIRNLEIIQELKARFDLVLLEADGSKKLRLKGWNSYEPVVTPCGDLTIGVVDVEAIGMTASDETVHRFEQFQNLTGIAHSETVDRDHIKKMIEHEHGLFRSFAGKKIVYFSHAPEDFVPDGCGIRTVAGDVHTEYVRAFE